MDKINVMEVENVHEQQIDGEGDAIEGNDNTQVEAPQASQASESANAGIQSPDNMAVMLSKFMDQLKDQMKEQSDHIKNQMKEQSNDIECRITRQLKENNEEIANKINHLQSVTDQKFETLVKEMSDGEAKQKARLNEVREEFTSQLCGIASSIGELQDRIEVGETTHRESISRVESNIAKLQEFTDRVDANMVKLNGGISLQDKLNQLERAINDRPNNNICNQLEPATLPPTEPSDMSTNDTVTPTVGTTEVCMNGRESIIVSDNISGCPPLPNFIASEVIMPKFADEPGQSPLIFLSELEDYFKLRAVHPLHQMLLVRSALIGQCRSWLKISVPPNSDYVTFKALFLAEYWGASKQNKIRLNFSQGKYEKKGKLGYHQYFMKKAENLKLLNPPPSDAEIIQGLTMHFPPWIRNVVIASRPEGIQEMATVLKELQLSEGSMTAQVSPPSNRVEQPRGGVINVDRAEYRREDRINNTRDRGRLYSGEGATGSNYRPQNNNVGRPYPNNMRNNGYRHPHNGGNRFEGRPRPYPTNTNTFSGNHRSRVDRGNRRVNLVRVERQGRNSGPGMDRNNGRWYTRRNRTTGQYRLNPNYWQRNRNNRRPINRNYRNNQIASSYSSEEDENGEQRDMTPGRSPSSN